MEAVQSEEMNLRWKRFAKQVGFEPGVTQRGSCGWKEW